MEEQQSSARHEPASSIAGDLLGHAVGCGFEGLLEVELEVLPVMAIVLIVGLIVLGLLTVLSSGSGEVLDAGSRLNLK